MYKKSRMVFVVLLALMMVCVFAACSNNSTPAPAPAPEPTPAPAATPEASQPAPSNDPYADLQPVTLIYGNGAAVGAAGDLWGEAFCKALTEITGGKLIADYYNNSQLGVDSEMQTQMLNGDIDIVSCQPAQTTAFVSAVAVFDLPLVFAKYDAQTIDKALNESEFTNIINKAYGETGMICLGYLQGATFREMTSNVKIEKIADFKGIKIRTMDNKYHLAFWQALGANPTPLPFTELYMSLQQGVVAAQENATDTCVNSNFFEVQKYLVNTHHILYMNQFLMNKAKFDSLAPAYQEAIRQALAQATAEIGAQMTKINDDNKQIMIDNGMESLEFADSFYDEVIAAGQSVYTQIRTDIGDEVVDALIDSLEAAK